MESRLIKGTLKGISVCLPAWIHSTPEYNIWTLIFMDAILNLHFVSHDKAHSFFAYFLRTLADVIIPTTMQFICKSFSC